MRTLPTLLLGRSLSRARLRRRDLSSDVPAEDEDILGALPVLSRGPAAVGRLSLPSPPPPEGEGGPFPGGSWGGSLRGGPPGRSPCNLLAEDKKRSQADHPVGQLAPKPGLCQNLFEDPFVPE